MAVRDDGYSQEETVTATEKTVIRADLIVRDLHTRTEVSRITISNLSENHVERVMLGMLHNMDTDNYFIDDREIDKARKLADKRSKRKGRAK